MGVPAWQVLSYLCDYNIVHLNRLSIEYQAGHNRSNYNQNPIDGVTHYLTYDDDHRVVLPSGLCLRRDVPDCED
jgi:hypothetical protein